MITNFKTQFLNNSHDKFYLILIGSISFTESFFILFSPAMGYDSGYHIAHTRFLFTHFPYAGWNFWNYFGTQAYLYPPFSFYFVSFFASLMPIELAYSVSRILTFCAIPILIYLLLRMWTIPQKPAFLASLVVLGSWMYLGDLYVVGHFPQDFSIMLFLVFILLYSKSLNSPTFASFWPIATSVCLVLAILSHYYVLFTIPIVMITTILINPDCIGRKNMFIRSLLIFFSAIGLSSFFLLNYVDAIYNKILVNLSCCKVEQLSLFIPHYDFYTTGNFFGFPFLAVIVLSAVVFMRHKNTIRNRLLILSCSWFLILFILTVSNFMTKLLPTPDREISFLIIFAGIVSGVILKELFEKSSKKVTKIILSIFCALVILSVMWGVNFMVLGNPFPEYPQEAKKSADFLNGKMKPNEVVFITSGFDSMWFNVYSNHFQSAGDEIQSAINKQLVLTISSISSNPNEIKKFMNETNSHFIILPLDDTEKFAKAGFHHEFSSKISSIMSYGNNTQFVSGTGLNNIKFSLENDQISLSLTNPEPTDVVIRESYDRNWHLQIDGKPVALGKNHLGFMTFYITSAGTHQILLKYSQPLIFIGSMISLTTIFSIFIGSKKKLAYK